nr:ribosome recycling factor [uncultured Agathobaculum sp.]
MKAQLNVYEEKMKKTLDVLAKELAAVRAGRANPAVLDKITVEYYGAQTPLSQVATISTPDARSLSVQPWDASVLKEIEKAIQTSDLGINPQNDGKQIRLNFPPLTEERRKELVKGVSKTGEDAKVALRNIRRDAIDKFKAAQKKSEMTEDELHDGEDKMQKLTDKYVKEIDGMIAKKSKELKEV